MTPASPQPSSSAAVGTPDDLRAAAYAMLTASLDPADVVLDVTSLLEQAGEVDDAVQLLMEQAEMAEVEGDMSAAMEFYARAFDIDSDTRRRCHALNERAMLALLAQPELAPACWDALHDECVRSGDIDGQARALCNRYFAATDDVAYEYLERAALLIGGTGGWSMRAQAQLAFLDQRFSDAITMSREVIRIARIERDRALEAVATTLIAICHALIGQLDEAMKLQRRSISQATSIREIVTVIVGRFNLFNMLNQAGDVVAAHAEASSLVTYVREHRAHAWLAEAEATQAHAALLLGRVGEALDLFDRTDSELPRSVATISDVFAALIRTSAFIECGYRNTNDLIEQALEACERFGIDHIAAELKFMAARQDALDGQVEQAIRAAMSIDTGELAGLAADVGTWLARTSLAHGHDSGLDRARSILEQIEHDEMPIVKLNAREIAATLEAAETGSVESLREMVMRWRRSGRMLEAAHTMMSMGAVEQRAGRSAHADEQYAAAQHAYLECDALAHVERAAHMRKALASSDTPIQHLDVSALLEGVSAADRHQLAGVAITRSFSSGHVFFSPEDDNSSVYVVRSGRVHLYCMTEDGKRLTVAMLDPGAVFGENVLLGNQHAGLHAETAEDSMIDAIPAARMLELMHRVPRIGINLLELVGERLRRSHELTEQVAFWNVDRRIISLILDLNDRYGHPTLDGRSIINRVFTQSDIAELVNARRETVGDVMKQLRAAGLIDMRKRRIVIVDEVVLRAQHNNAS